MNCRAFRTLSLTIASAAAVLASSATPQDNPQGNLSVVVPAEGTPVSSNPGVWTPVPGLSTGVYSQEGDSLEIALSAEMLGTAAVWLRAVVDGRGARPAYVQFKSDQEIYDGIRSFTFVHRGMSAGQHVVEIQWYTYPGAVSQMGDRTLTVQSASPSRGIGRLAVAAGLVWLSNSSPGWQDVPDLATAITTEGTSTFAITFSADSVADSGRFFARALIDGVEVSDVLFAEAGEGAVRAPRAYTFVKSEVPAGIHDVRIQWRAASGTTQVRSRTLSVFATRGLTATGGMEAMGLQSAPSTINTTRTWVDIPSASTSFGTFAPSTSAAVTFGAELQNYERDLHVRALVDGRIVRPRDVSLIRGMVSGQAVSYSFTVKNLPPGRHTVRFQARGHSRFGDRFWRIVHKQRSGSEFAQPFYAMAPKHRSFPTLAICFDPVRPAHPRPSMALLRGLHEGDDGDLSLMGWFAENSGGRVAVGAADTVRYVGCADGSWYLAPPEHRGEWYWDHGAFDVMWQDAIRAADRDVDFHAYDLNLDGQITPDELVLEIVRPQNDPYGTVRHTHLAVDGNSTPMTFTLVDAYLSASVDRRRWSVGLLAHEVSHAVLGAWDQHSCASETQPGLYGIMDEHQEATHLDPLHKLKSGFIVPDLVEVGSWTTRTLALAPVETSRKVTLLYDPARNDREYFVLENRYGGGRFSPNYDEPLQGGVVVWHLFEDAALSQQYPPTGGEACGFDRNSARRLRVLDYAGETYDLHWADGTPVGLRVTIGGPGTPVDPDVLVEIARLP